MFTPNPDIILTMLMCNIAVMFKTTIFTPYPVDVFTNAE